MHFLNWKGAHKESSGGSIFWLETSFFSTRTISGILLRITKCNSWIKPRICRRSLIDRAGGARSLSIDI
ncbi:hypothetical protein QE152_g10270 [Popillia japonica]|uniref:Uncharacterized protein n=1 Tax=Popillia japonica TaxID=7064 RepID=A0AAW1LTX3_POPJA